jgi:hypothetical protein
MISLYMCVGILLAWCCLTQAQVVINEIVTDPKQDWNDSSEGDGTPFNDVPGTSAGTSVDEWVELYNAGIGTVDITDWSLAFCDGTASYLLFSAPGSSVLRFSDGGSVTNFQPGEYLVVGNPPGSMLDTIFIALRSTNDVPACPVTTFVVDAVELGDDPQGDGNGDSAPDGGIAGGDSLDLSDESIVRTIAGVDTDDDVADFRPGTASIGGPRTGVHVFSGVLINEICVDPVQDWDDTTDGNGVPFDDVPGTGDVTSVDEWIELYNSNSFAVDISGALLEMLDTTPESVVLSEETLTPMRFSDGGSVTNFQAGEYLVIGNPIGGMNFSIYIRLMDGLDNVVTDVELGDDLENDGSGDGAPHGTSDGGGSTGLNDETVVRIVSGVNTDDDVADFRRDAASIGGPRVINVFDNVRINEVCVDPQQDWGDTEGGNGEPFDDLPGSGSVSSADEWIELVNANPFPVNIAGAALEMRDTTPSFVYLNNGAVFAMQFSQGGSVTNFLPGEYLTIGEPEGTMNNNTFLSLNDGLNAAVDSVELGDDSEGDGAGDGAPNGNATGPQDETVSRMPNGIDTGSDPDDFSQGGATIGSFNGGSLGSPTLSSLAHVDDSLQILATNTDYTVFYRVEQATNLLIADWIPIQGFISTGLETNLTIQLTNNAASLFFRLTSP